MAIVVFSSSASSTTPARCIPCVISTISARMRALPVCLRSILCALATVLLRLVFVGDHLVQRLVRRGQQTCCSPFQGCQLVIVDVRPC